MSARPTPAIGHEHHRKHAPKSVRVFVLTVSDTRTEETDTGGKLCQELCAAAGHQIAGARIVPDDPEVVREVIREAAKGGLADVLIATGGTGISRRDNTYEAVAGLLDKRLDGFGELFRMRSYAEIGSAAMLSRAVGGLCGPLVVFAVPGSVAAVRLALSELIVPELSHLVFEARR